MSQLLDRQCYNKRQTVMQSSTHMDEGEKMPSVQEMKIRFESPVHSPESSLPGVHQHLGRGDESVVEADGSRGNTRTNLVRKCPRPPPATADDELLQPSACAPLPCKIPHAYVNLNSGRNHPEYVNLVAEQGVQSAALPPPIMPRKTVIAATAAPLNNISPADKKCLMQKVPAPAPRLTKREKGRVSSETGSAMTSAHVEQVENRLVPQDDNNNSETVKIGNGKQDNSESKKPVDCAVSTPSLLDDEYLELNKSVATSDVQPTDRHETGLDSLGSQVQGNGTDSDISESLDQFNKSSDDVDPTIQPPKQGSEMTANSKVVPPLPHKARRMHTGGTSDVCPPTQCLRTKMSQPPMPPPRRGKPAAPAVTVCRKPTLDFVPETGDFSPEDQSSGSPCKASVGQFSPDTVVPAPEKPEVLPSSITSAPSPLPSPPPSPPLPLPPPPPVPSPASPSHHVPTVSPVSHPYKPSEQTEAGRLPNKLKLEVPAPAMVSKNITSPGVQNVSSPQLPTPPPALRNRTNLAGGYYINPEDVESKPDKPSLPPWAIDKLVHPEPMSPNSHSKQDSYLQLEDDEDSKMNETDEDDYADEDNDYYSFLKEEPLYQMYHTNVVFRDIVHQRRELVAMQDTGATDEYADDESDDDEYVNMEIQQILSSNPRVASIYDVLPQTQSSLQDIIKLGAGTRKLWAEMSQVKQSGILDRLTTQERNLQEALFEVITSEASYVKSMNLLVNHFLSAPELDTDNMRCSVISKLQHHYLFSNITEVHEVCQKFLQKLENLWHASCLLEPIQMADTITEFASEHFKVYVSYVSNMMYQERTLKELRNTNSEFVEVLKRLESHSEVQGLSLQSFLVLPMQRITRLPLLISTICEKIRQDEQQQKALRNCLSVLQKIVRHCNESARQMNNIEQVANISKMLEFKNIKKIPIVSQHRSVIKQGELTRIKPNKKMFVKNKNLLYLFLFNDLLLVTKKKSNNSYQVLEHESRISIHADLINTDDVKKWLPQGAPKDCQHLFVMILMEKNITYILSCASENERTRWVEAVTPAQQVNEYEKIYEEWDCPQVQAVQKYVAQQPDELSLEVSDIMNVLRKVSDGWYEGQRIRDGEKGWFPSEVTVEIQSAHIRAKNLRQQYRLMYGFDESD